MSALTDGVNGRTPTRTVCIELRAGRPNYPSNTITPISVSTTQRREAEDVVDPHRYTLRAICNWKLQLSAITPWPEKTIRSLP
jgi:hypothetical protein